jgi:hypothetical protein
MTWAHWKNDFRAVIAKHLRFYYLEYLMIPETPDIKFKDFIKNIPKIWAGNTNRHNPVRKGLEGLGYYEHPPHFLKSDETCNINWLTIKSDGAVFDIADNPFVLAEIYKRANQRF